MSNNDKDYEMCMRVEGVVLPKNGFFGISAATGGLADDHDVLKFNVFRYGFHNILCFLIIVQCSNIVFEF